MEEKSLSHQLSKKYVQARLVSELIGNALWLIVLLILFWMYHFFEWPRWVFWILIGLSALSLLGIVWSFLEPYYVYRNWRYHLDEDYLQLSYGILTKTWITIPTAKIQAVTTIQGPILKRYRLRSVKVETIGSSYTIPGLDEDVALSLRKEIAQWAKIKDTEAL